MYDAIIFLGCLVVHIKWVTCTATFTVSFYDSFVFAVQLRSYYIHSKLIKVIRIHTSHCKMATFSSLYPPMLYVPPLCRSGDAEEEDVMNLEHEISSLQRSNNELEQQMHHLRLQVRAAAVSV